MLIEGWECLHLMECECGGLTSLCTLGRHCLLEWYVSEPIWTVWNKLGTFLWILEYDLQLGRKVVQYYDPQIEHSF